MSREDPQLKIRLPLELKEKIIESAADFGRSINSEVVARLENSYASNLVASDPYKRMLLAVIAGIIAEQADREKPSFKEAIDRIVRAIQIDEKTLLHMLDNIKKAP